MAKAAAAERSAAPLNVFIGRATKPSAADLKAALGTAYKRWEQLVEELRRDSGIDKQEWYSYSQKAGWSLRLQSRGRNIVYLVPCRNSFWVSFALGEEAMAAARAAGLPPRLLKVLDTAKKYAEGTGVRFEVGENDLEWVKKLVTAKIEN